MADLSVRLDYEFGSYEMWCQCTSRQYLFTNAEEIVRKKCIYRYLKKYLPLIENDENLVISLWALDNILDAADGFLREQPAAEYHLQLREWLERQKN